MEFYVQLQAPCHLGAIEPSSFDRGNRNSCVRFPTAEINVARKRCQFSQFCGTFVESLKTPHQGSVLFAASGMFWAPKESCVTSCSFARIVLMAMVIFTFATPGGAWPHKQEQKARVRFLATSTLIRGTWGQNEDTYLAQLDFRRNDEKVLVRLMDAYPNETPPLSMDALKSDAGTVLRVLRDRQCDRPYGEMPLRTAPGDPMAILLEPLRYRPHLDAIPEPSAILLCYRTVRQ